MDPLLDKGGEPAVGLGSGASKSANISVSAAKLNGQVRGIEGSFGCRFGGAGTDYKALGRGGEVSHVWAVLSKALKEASNFCGWSFEGEVVGIPGLEDGGVLAAEVFSKGKEADPIQDHSPGRALHDAFAAEDDGGSSADGALQQQLAFMAVHVVDKPGSARPSVSHFPE